MLLLSFVLVSTRFTFGGATPVYGDGFVCFVVCGGWSLVCVSVVYTVEVVLAVATDAWLASSVALFFCICCIDDGGAGGDDDDDDSSNGSAGVEGGVTGGVSGVPAGEVPLVSLLSLAIDINESLERSRWGK
uniref:Putative secreted protein n=1 Tax=Anopheles triannulatus TaxID=58253 RepID=A0A2M4B3N2_9DIPT